MSKRSYTVITAGDSEEIARRRARNQGSSGVNPPSIRERILARRQEHAFPYTEVDFARIETRIVTQLAQWSQLAKGPWGKPPVLDPSGIVARALRREANLARLGQQAARYAALRYAGSNRLQVDPKKEAL